MKIDKVIVSSTKHKSYIDFWPIVKKAWKNIGIEPILVYTSPKKIKFKNHEGIINFHVEGIDPVFTAQNIRLLLPILFPKSICLTSDIDILPLSAKYFLSNIQDVKDNNFVVYRPDACPPNMLALCFNAALGSTWGEIFGVKNEEDIRKTLNNWYPKNYKPRKNGWYHDQVILREKLDMFSKANKNRVKILNDDINNFNRLNRDTLTKDVKNYITGKEDFSDFHMPRPYTLYKKKIDSVFVKAFDEIS
jgi:hypothetical protein|tara:strand:+ start:165 stop:908 length:744 start_codon:yes stop_codon:yes gene_type:complete